MKLDPVEWTLGALIASVFVVLVVSVAGFIGSQAWSASEKAAAYRAYVACLDTMKQQPIDVQQTFCGKIREQL